MERKVHTTLINIMYFVEGTHIINKIYAIIVAVKIIDISHLGDKSIIHPNYGLYLISMDIL